MKNKTKNGKKRRWIAVLLGVLIFVLAVLGGLQLGCHYTENSWKQWYPDYEPVDISALLQKDLLTEEEYDLLYRQTGLTRLAIDDMRTTHYGRQRIRGIQERFFADYTVTPRGFAPFTYTEEIDSPSLMCDLKDGDIIVTATTRVSWWRYGHAAIVVDGESGILAESIGPGQNSEMASVEVCKYYADFLVFRPKVDEAVKEQVANFVVDEMLDMPYRFTVGILSKKYKENIKYSQCAHFVWYAYKKFGIDLDSNGGGLVKPQDMALSDKVELVQAFGFDLDKLWS